MNRKFNRSLLILTCLSSIFLISCSEYNDKTNVSTNINQDKKYNNEKLYRKEIASNVTVEANVTIPEMKETPVLKASKKKFNPLEVKEIMMKNTEANKVEEIIEIFGEKIPSTKFQSNANEVLSVQDGFIDYSQYGNYTLSIMRVIDPEVWKKEELDFMSKDSAIQTAINICNQLEIDIDKNSIDTIAIDYETLSNEYNKIVESGGLKEAFLDKEISKESEAYVIELSSVLKEIPIYSQNITLQSSDKIISGTSIVFIINKEGVAQFNVYGLVYSLEEIKEDNPELIDIDTAIETVGSIYTNMITEDIITIIDISLKYIPIQDNKNTSEYELVPSWCFEVEVNGFDKKINEEYKSINYININAKTGEEII